MSPEPQAEESEVVAALAQFHAESGRTLLELVDASPTLLVFLRHFGCSFCRQTLEDVSGVRAKLEARGAQPVFVHLGSPDRAKPYFDYYRLTDVERISDPEATLYTHPLFRLPRVHPLLHLLRWQVWKGWIDGALREHGIGGLHEDAQQMPGVFFIRDRKLARSYRYRTIADRPDYLRLVGGKN